MDDFGKKIWLNQSRSVNPETAFRSPLLSSLTL